MHAYGNTAGVIVHYLDWDYILLNLHILLLHVQWAIVPNIGLFDIMWLLWNKSTHLNSTPTNKKNVDDMKMINSRLDQV